MRLAIVTTHPIQYNAPLFRKLSSQPGLEVKVFYTLGRNFESLKDKGFGKAIVWDIPLLEGYKYEFLRNVSSKPGSSHHKGIVNPEIIAAITAFEPTAILVYGWNFHSHLRVIRYFKGKVPLYFRGDSTLLNEIPGLKTIARRIVLSWVYRYIDRALYVGSNNKYYYLRHGINKQNLHFAPHAIDNERFGKDEWYLEDALSIRNELGVPEDHVLFASIGKLESVKDPFLLLDAFIELNAAHAHLLFVGNGPHEEELKNKAAGFGNVHFLDFQNQKVIPAIYRVADVFVLPSKSETWGLAVNEAMACGLPIIVSDKVGCAVDLVHEKKNGFIFKSGDLKSLICKLSAFVSMPTTELKKMGEESKKIIAVWSFEEACEAIVAALPKASS